MLQRIFNKTDGYKIVCESYTLLTSDLEGQVKQKIPSHFTDTEMEGSQEVVFTSLIPTLRRHKLVDL